MNILKISNPQRKWYQVILWWEIRRIPYNIIMYLTGLLSFYICFVTIPLIYLLIGLLLNIIYTVGWIFELIFVNKFKEQKRLNYPMYAFISYLILSAFFILGFAVFLFIIR